MTVSLHANTLSHAPQVSTAGTQPPNICIATEVELDRQSFITDTNVEPHIAHHIPGPNE
jgi:hypothetical protein